MHLVLLTRRPSFVIASALVSLLAGSFESAAAQQAKTLTGDLEYLEALCGFKPGANVSVIDRILNLERKVFGVEQYGPLVPRLSRLRQAVGASHPQGNTAEPNSAAINTPTPATSGQDNSVSAPTVPRVTDPAHPFQVKVTEVAPPPSGQANLLSNDAFPAANAFPPSFVRVAQPNDTTASLPDYYEEVRKASKNKSIHFKTMPIPVYIQPYPDKDFVNCVIRSFESWEHRTAGAVRFVQVDNSEQARIRVYWKHLGGNADTKGCLLGAHTILKYTDRGGGNLSFVGVGAVPIPVYVPRMGPKYNVPPQVMEVNLDLIATKDNSIKYRCLQNIVTHELGHALGLLGHSPSQADIMFPVTDEHSRLSQRDLNTLIKLYNTKADIPL